MSSPTSVDARVGTTTAVAPKELHTYHLNPRRGDVSAIAASLRTHGQYKPITVNIGTFTGRRNEVLAGNHTLMAFRDLAESDPDGFDRIKVHWVDVDDDTAARIVAVDNRTSELGTVDTDTLLELLEGLGDDLAGTGYDQDYLTMLNELAAGAPSLDDLADAHGDPEPDDHHDSVRLSLDPEIARRWTLWRAQFSDDTAALVALLDTAGAPA